MVLTIPLTDYLETCCSHVGDDIIFPLYRVRRLREAGSFPYIILAF